MSCRNFHFDASKTIIFYHLRPKFKKNHTHNWLRITWQVQTLVLLHNIRLLVCIYVNPDIATKFRRKTHLTFYCYTIFMSNFLFQLLPLTSLPAIYYSSRHFDFNVSLCFLTLRVSINYSAKWFTWIIGGWCKKNTILIDNRKKIPLLQWLGDGR